MTDLRQKSEFRNQKPESMPNAEARTMSGEIRHSDFVIDSDFGLRHSDLCRALLSRPRA